MALTLDLHPITPQQNKVRSIAQELHNGAVMLYPTDTGFALGCDLANKSAIERIRNIRNMSDDKPMTFLCDSLTHIAEFAKVSNSAYKMIKRLIPGPFTFILPATKSVPKFAQSAKRKTVGIRVPENVIAQALIKELGNPVISISAKFDDEIHTPEEIIDQLKAHVDIIIISHDYNFEGESTVVDMTQDEFSLIREGARADEAIQHMPDFIA